MGLNFAKAAPKVVAQAKSNPNCWAAALECWVAAQKPKTLFTTTLAKGVTQTDFATYYKDHIKDGGLLKSGLTQIAWDMQMGFDVLLVPKTVFTGAYLHQKLAAKGYLWCAFGGNSMTSTAMGHCVVIYGIDDAYGKNCTIKHMDPWEPGNLDRPIDWFKDSKSMLVTWAETEAGWATYMKKNWNLP